VLKAELPLPGGHQKELLQVIKEPVIEFSPLYVPEDSELFLANRQHRFSELSR